MAIAPKVLDHARSASRWLPEVLATSIPILAILGGFSWAVRLRTNELAARLGDLSVLCPVAALYLVLWWQADRPIALAGRSSSAFANRWCFALGILTVTFGLLLRAVWPTAESVLWPDEWAGGPRASFEAALRTAWGSAYLFHAMLVFWVIPPLLAFAIVRRLAGTMPAQGRFARWILAVGCVPALVAAGRMWDEDATAGRAPMAAAFGAVAVAAFVARLFERRQLASNLVGAAQALLFIALSIATRAFEASSTRTGYFGRHPLEFITSPHGRYLHEVVTAVDWVTAMAAAFWMASLAVDLEAKARPRPYDAARLATLALGLAAQVVTLHARHWEREAPRGIANVPLPTVRSEELLRPLSKHVQHVDVVLASSPPYRVVARDDRVLAWLRRGPIPRNHFEADMHGMGFSDTEIAAFVPYEPTESVGIGRIVVAAPGSMPLTRLRALVRELGVTDVASAFSVVVAVDVHREQPGLEMSPAVTREYALVDLRETSEPPGDEPCARVRMDAGGSVHVVATPAGRRPFCWIDLRVDPAATVADLVLAIAPHTDHASYRIDTGPNDDDWRCAAASTADATEDPFESGHCGFR